MNQSQVPLMLAIHMIIEILNTNPLVHSKEHIETSILVIERRTSKIRQPLLARILQCRLGITSWPIMSNVDLLDYFLKQDTAEVVCIRESSQGKCNTMWIPLWSLTIRRRAGTYVFFRNEEIFLPFRLSHAHSKCNVRLVFTRLDPTFIVTSRRGDAIRVDKLQRMQC